MLHIALHSPTYIPSCALHCMPLYMHFSMHWITYPSICIFTCTICLYILLVSHFTCIKGFLAAWQLQHINLWYLSLDSYQNLILSLKQTLSFSLDKLQILNQKIIWLFLNRSSNILSLSDFDVDYYIIL